MRRHVASNSRECRVKAFFFTEVSQVRQSLQAKHLVAAAAGEDDPRVFYHLPEVKIVEMHVGGKGRFNEHIFIILWAGERKNASEMPNFAFDPEVRGQPGSQISLLILVERL